MRDRIRNKLTRLDPKRWDPSRGHYAADASVVAVCVLDVIREAATLVAPVIVVFVFVVFWMIEAE